MNMQLQYYKLPINISLIQQWSPSIFLSSLPIPKSSIAWMLKFKCSLFNLPKLTNTNVHIAIQLVISGSSHVILVMPFISLYACVCYWCCGCNLVFSILILSQYSFYYKCAALIANWSHHSPDNINTLTSHTVAHVFERCTVLLHLLNIHVMLYCLWYSLIIITNYIIIKIVLFLDG